MKKAIFKVVVLGGMVIAINLAGGAATRSFEGPPTPVCTPTTCLPPVQ